MDKKTKLIIAAALIALGVACRLLPHLGNFAPIAGIALFAGAYLGKRYAVALPIVTMAIGDLFIGFYELPLMIAVYASFAVVGLLGVWLGRHKTFGHVFGTSVLASVLFFAATNWAVWQFSPWYAKDLAGLLNCFVVALPFFRHTLLGDLFYASVLFGAYEAVSIWLKQVKLVGILEKN
jgi:hypothetical protein